MKRKDERNYVVLAMVRAAKRSVAHGKTKKARRKLERQNFWKEELA